MCTLPARLRNITRRLSGAQAPRAWRKSVLRGAGDVAGEAAALAALERDLGARRDLFLIGGTIDGAGA